MAEAVSRKTIAAGAVVAAAVGWLLSVFAVEALAAPRVALVIGNAAYAHAPALANPLNDAQDVGAALGRLGFAITRLENAGYAALRRGLLEFQRAAASSEVAVVFYAGHGIEVDQRNFLVPVDARLASDQDVEFEAVPLELVSRAVERASGLRLVILDACRENPFAVSMQRAGATRSIGRGLARLEPSGETLVAYAAKEGTVASDGSGRNSPYSEALLRHLEEPGLEVGLMFRRVRDAVLATTGGRQEPFVYGSLSSRGAYLAARPAPKPSPAVQPSRAEASDSPQVAADRELLFWESVKDSEHPADIQAYLDRYPGGTYEALARNRLKRLEGASEDSMLPEPALEASLVSDRREAEREFWALVKGSEVSGDLEAYLEQYPDGVYAALARLRLRQLQRVRERPAPQVAVAPAAPGPGTSSPPPPAEPSPESVESSLGLGRLERLRIQQGLASLGFSPGPADGLVGKRTRMAIRSYQQEKGLPETGYVTVEQSEALQALGEEAVRAKEAARVWERERVGEERRETERLADDAAYARAKSMGKMESYGEYLSSYPSGRHVVEARELRAEAERLAREQKAPGRVFRDCAECPELVVLPAGSYTMGSRSGEKGRDSDEGPALRVRIGEPFAVGVHEVTFAEWEACRRGGGCSRNPGDGGWGRGNRPVMNVSWDDAKSYVGWLSRKTGEGYRLLSESEWEYAARGGATTRYHWGDAIGRNRANCSGCGSRSDSRKTSPVGSFSPNAYGLHDVHGNVWEWVEDCWHSSYAGAPPDGSAWTRRGDCSSRVLRGGSWYSIPEFLRSASRYGLTDGNRKYDIGFRVARTLD